jgi:hypothetical protein
VTEPAWSSKSGNFWQRRSKLGKVLIIVALVIIAISVIAALVPSEDEEASSPNTVTETVTDQDEEPSDETEPVPVAPEEDVETVTGRVNGTFARDCFGCGDLKRYIKASNAWCGWRGDTLLVHVRMTNESIEHVTVNWHPSYTFVGGGEHGAGITSIQSDGFDAGETRDLIAEQQPDGVPVGSRIGKCKPSFFLIESG